MDSFKRKMVLDTIPFEVHFTKIDVTNGVKFFVFTCDQSGNVYSFNMERNGAGWRVVNAPSVTELILKNEKKLSDVINRALKHSR
jgi:hypothetical protein